MDDVIGWMISVAKQHQIPVEDMNMHRFANCTGPLLMLMNQQNFIDRDNAYGYLLYVEFRKLIGGMYLTFCFVCLLFFSCKFLFAHIETLLTDDSSILDEWMRMYKDDTPSSSTSSSASTVSRAHSRHIDQPSTSAQADGTTGLPPSLHMQRDSVIKAAGKKE